VTFKLDPLDPASDLTVRDVNLIEVGGLSASIHNLTVVFNGPSTPLVLNRLLVQGGNFVIEPEGLTPSSTTSSASVLPLPSDTFTSTKGQDVPSSSSSAGARIGAIAGGVVGGMVIFALMLSACFIARRKHRKRGISDLHPSDSTQTTSAPKSSPSASTPVTSGHTAQLARKSAYHDDPSSGPSEVTSPPGYQSREEKPTKRWRETPAEPSSTLIPAPITLQAHGITTNQGDVALAGRDIHFHKHYHWNTGMAEVDAH
jgi:hypothetical protein